LFQDIEPYVFHNEYAAGKVPAETDYVIFAKKSMLLVESAEDAATLPLFGTASKLFPEAVKNLIYLFSVDGASFFLSLHEVAESDRFKYQNPFMFREFKPGWLGFAGATASHLGLWYDTHRYCGRCTTPTHHKADERAVVCPACGNIEYPKIAPVVIVGITDGDRLLLTKYAAGYARYALVAGFVEIGETLEGAVHREVLEEVGLRVKNIRYYKSQPWAFSGSVLSGFFAEVDGDRTIRVDQHELSEAVWFDRKDIPTDGNTMSLTWTMVEAFRAGEV
jgi:NAD+ diphosphatase